MRAVFRMALHCLACGSADRHAQLEELRGSGKSKAGLRGAARDARVTDVPGTVAPVMFGKRSLHVLAMYWQIAQ